MKEPDDKTSRRVVESWHVAAEIRTAENEILGLELPCSCPSWWFPADIRDIAKRMPHNPHAGLMHHSACDKVAHLSSSLWPRKTRFA